MHTIVIAVIAVLLIGTTGCATSNHPEPEQAQVLRDDLFPSHHLFDVETPHEIFALNEEAKEFVRRTQASQRDTHENMRALLNQIFDYSELGLLYQGSANSVASATFDNRAANCLSLSVISSGLSLSSFF